MWTSVSPCLGRRLLNYVISKVFPPAPCFRGLHSFTSQLNLSAVYGIGGA